MDSKAGATFGLVPWKCHFNHLHCAFANLTWASNLHRPQISFKYVKDHRCELCLQLWPCSFQQFKGFCTVNWSPWMRLPMSSSSVTCWGVWEETLSGNELNCGVCQLVPAQTALKTNKFLVMSTQCLLTTWNIHWILLPWSFVQLKFKLKDHHFVITLEKIHLHCKDTSERGYITGNRTSVWKWSWLGILI